LAANTKPGRGEEQRVVRSLEPAHRDAAIGPGAERGVAAADPQRRGVERQKGAQVAGLSRHAVSPTTEAAGARAEPRWNHGPFGRIRMRIRRLTTAAGPAAVAADFLPPVRRKVGSCRAAAGMSSTSGGEFLALVDVGRAGQREQQHAAARAAAGPQRVTGRSRSWLPSTRGRASVG